MPSKTHRLFEVVAFIQLDPVGEIFGYLRHGMNPVHVELAGALQPDKALENKNMRINCNPISARDLREAVDRSSAFKVEFGTRDDLAGHVGNRHDRRERAQMLRVRQLCAKTQKQLRQGTEQAVGYLIKQYPGGV